jgi:hypothetical protein
MRVFRLWGEHAHRVAGRGSRNADVSVQIPNLFVLWSDHSVNITSFINSCIVINAHNGLLKEFYQNLDHDRIAVVHDSPASRLRTMSTRPTPDLRSQGR